MATRRKGETLDEFRLRMRGYVPPCRRTPEGKKRHSQVTVAHAKERMVREPEWKAKRTAAILEWAKTPAGKASRSKANARWRQGNRDEYLAYMRENKKVYYQRLRMQVIEGYGGRCKCCGIDEPVFMALDHVNNDGNIERRAINKAGKNKGVEAAIFYRKVIAEKFPDRYQLLCHNCNHAKRFGVCPHKMAVRV